VDFDPIFGAVVNGLLLAAFDGFQSVLFWSYLRIEETSAKDHEQFHASAPSTFWIAY